MSSLIDDCDARFEELSERFCEGDLTEAQFKERVAELKVQDSSGTWWRMSSENGDWMRFDGDTWVMGGKPADAVDPEDSHPSRKAVDEPPAKSQVHRHPARKELEDVLPEPVKETPRGLKARLGRCFRYLLGALLMAYGIGVPLLGLVGGRANGVVTDISSSIDYDNKNSETETISYDFTLADGSEHSGFFMTKTKRYGSSNFGNGEVIEVRYVPGLPFLSVPSKGTALSIGYVIFAAVGFIMLSPPRWPNRKKTKREKAAVKPR